MCNKFCRISRTQIISRKNHGHIPDIYETNFDQRYVALFNRTDIDGFELRRGMTLILGMDLIPDPKIVIAALKACRRVNDYALAVRWLESCRFKCINHLDTIYPWIIQEIRPTLKELSISTPEEMGYDFPELFLQTTD